METKDNLPKCVPSNTCRERENKPSHIKTNKTQNVIYKSYIMKEEFFGLLCGCTLLPAFLHAQTERPNIVIVLADDLGWGDVGFHGSEIKTPSLDALVGEGVELERFYTSPISTPTRAGLMTGRYPNRFGVRSAVIPPWREDGLDENEETMADMLARNGYKNRAIIGKWHLGHTKKVHYPMNRGFSHFYGHLNGAIDYFDLTREGELDWHNDWETCHDKGYSTELITQEAIRCIDAYEKEGPFMLYVAYNAPHTPLQAQEKDIKLYTDNFDSLTPKEQKKATYSAMVSCMDRGIGAIVDALKKKGIMDNTFFIFFSDNGTAGVPGSSSGPLRGHKFDEWDGGGHAPAVLYWKKAEKQYKNLSSQVTGFVDLVPTLKDLVGDHSRPKREYDGISILPVLNGKKTCIDRDFYLGHGAVVNKDYKLIRKGMKPGLDLKQDFLVDYKTDPYEKKNASAGNEKIVKALYEVALKYDTITPCIPEVPYGKGRDGFKAPKEWKVVR
ncbi:arylsulfatase [Bacteroides sp. D1]|nr:arylsulfatase [Bacteroides sp. D1]